MHKISEVPVPQWFLSFSWENKRERSNRNATRTRAPNVCARGEGNLDMFSRTLPCPICHGLGFVSHDDRQTGPGFNFTGLTRRVHPDGRVTWEGDCVWCKATGRIK